MLGKRNDKVIVESAGEKQHDTDHDNDLPSAHDVPSQGLLFLLRQLRCGGHQHKAHEDASPQDNNRGGNVNDTGHNVQSFRPISPCSGKLIL